MDTVYWQCCSVNLFSLAAAAAQQESAPLAVNIKLNWDTKNHSIDRCIHTPWECMSIRAGVEVRQNNPLIPAQGNMTCRISMCINTVWKSPLFVSFLFPLSSKHYHTMISITRTWRRISTQLKSNLSRKRSTSSTSSYGSKSGKSVRFYTVDTIYYTHSAIDYDRTPSDEDLSSIESDES